MDENDLYELFSDPDACCGVIWMLAHWLLPAKATREDALSLIELAYADRQTGQDIANREDW